MRQHLVYDLPTRFFHWLFAGLFLVAFIIAKTIEDESALFSVHSLAGITLCFVVLLRLIWGLWGTQHARLSDFALRPRDLLSYFKGILSGSKQRWAGHNPASSWAAITMMILALGLGFTGYMMTSGPDKETFEDAHEIFANGFVIVVILHVAGIVLHTIRFQDMIGLSMIDGKKSGISAEQTISPSRRIEVLVTGIIVTLIVAFSLNLFKNYNTEKRSLQLFGTTLQLGKAEKHDDSKSSSDD